METRKIRTPTGWVFDAFVEGPEDGELVLFLHGFPQSRHAWISQIEALAAAGYRAVAPDQRGYSPAARPEASDLSHYTTASLVQDVAEIAKACMKSGEKFHLVGMDWGGQIAWAFAAMHPEQLATLNVFSRPHPNAFVTALETDPDQQRRSSHHRDHLDPCTGKLLLANDAQRLKALFQRGKVPLQGIENYLSVIGEPAAIEAALAWYRSTGLKINLTPISVPTLYAWGDEDSTVGRSAAQNTANYVSGPYQFVEMRGIGHFCTDQAPQLVNEILLKHIKASCRQ